MDDPLMASKEVATLLGVAPATLDDWAHRKVGPGFIKVGRARRYRRAVVEAWLAANTIATN